LYEESKIKLQKLKSIATTGQVISPTIIEPTMFEAMYRI